VPYAIVLLTPDDEGRALSELTPKPRARQNVILELGYFVGKLGRRGRRGMCALHNGNVEIPSDYHGVVYVSMDEADWKFRIAAELRQAGYAVDFNRLG
jgi:predicted nucleotide-binding protein